MPNRRYRLPQLGFIQGFEAAARNLSFTKAAEELFITQSAVSRQVKALEVHLGVTLFELATGRLVGLIEFTEGIHEVFAVEILPGMRCPAISGPFVARDETQPNYLMPENLVTGKGQRGLNGP